MNVTRDNTGDKPPSNTDGDLRWLAYYTAGLNNRLLHTVEMVKDLAELMSNMEQGLIDREAVLEKLEAIQNKSGTIIDELVEAKDAFIRITVGEQEE